MRLRGLVWIGVGVLVYVGGLLADHPIYLRWTRVPLGWVIAAIGVAYLVYDAWKRRRDQEAPPAEK